MSKLLTASVVAATLVLALAGCVSGSADEGTKQSGTESSSSSGAGVEKIDPDDVIVEQTVAIPGSDDEVTIGVSSLRVEGKTQVLTLVVTPRFGSAGKSEKVTLFDVWSTNAFRPTLVDMKNLKVYSPITDNGQRWTSGSALTGAKNGESFIAWAVYAAPEDDVESFDIRLQDSWPQFTDVPVER